MNPFQLSAYGTFLLRVALGAMFLAHGLTKLFVVTPVGTAALFSSIGFAPWLAYPVIAFEICAGLMLVFGVFSRWVGAAAALQLLVASSVHWANGWAFGNPHGGWEYPVFLAVTAAAIACLGDGAFALVRPSSRKRRTRTSSGMHNHQAW